MKQVSDETRRALAEAHADITQELNWNEPGHEPNLVRIAEALAKVLPVLGGFCGHCSGTGDTWRGNCRHCAGTGDLSTAKEIAAIAAGDDDDAGFLS